MRDMIITRFPQAEEIISENNQKRWYIPQGVLKDFINFSAEELSALETAKELFENKQMAEKSRALEKIIAKIRASIKPDAIRRIEPDTEALLEAEGFICHPGPKLVIDEKIINAIRQAILEYHQIRIKYYNKNTGKISTNTLNPYGFLYGERNHYLVAHHADGYYGNEVHNFILSNIREVEILNSELKTCLILTCRNTPKNHLVLITKSLSKLNGCLIKKYRKKHLTIFFILRKP